MAKKKTLKNRHPIFTKRPGASRRAARRIWDALAAKGFKDIKLWYDIPGRSMEMCGPTGGWIFEADTGSVDHYLGWNVADALAAVEGFQPVLKA